MQDMTIMIDHNKVMHNEAPFNQNKSSSGRNIGGKTGNQDMSWLWLIGSYAKKGFMQHSAFISEQQLMLIWTLKRP